METTIRKSLKGVEMEIMFETQHEKINIKFYENSSMKEDDEFRLLKTYKYKLLIRHPEGTDASQLFDEALEKVRGTITKSLLTVSTDANPTPKPYIVIKVKGGVVTDLFANQELQVKVVDRDGYTVTSENPFIMPENDLDAFCIAAEEAFEAEAKEFEADDDWDGEQDFEFGPTGHGDICHSDADSGL
jgi:hypothetical protein